MTMFLSFFLSCYEKLYVLVLHPCLHPVFGGKLYYFGLIGKFLPERSNTCMRGAGLLRVDIGAVSNLWMSRQRQRSPISKSGSTQGQSRPLVCCCLVPAATNTGCDATRQCIIVDLGEKASKCLKISCSPPLALLTNHSTIPSLSHVGEWKLHVGALRESPKRVFNLKETAFEEY